MGPGTSDYILGVIRTRSQWLQHSLSALAEVCALSLSSAFLVLLTGLRGERAFNNFRSHDGDPSLFIQTTAEQSVT